MPIINCINAAAQMLYEADLPQDNDNLLLGTFLGITGSGAIILSGLLYYVYSKYRSRTARIIRETENDDHHEIIEMGFFLSDDEDDHHELIEMGSLLSDDELTNNNNNESLPLIDIEAIKKLTRAEQVEKLNIKDIPEEFLCPISLLIMEDPVITERGRSYDRVNLAKCVESKKIDPVSNVALEDEKLFLTNSVLNEKILKWLDQKIEEFGKQEQEDNTVLEVRIQEEECTSPGYWYSP